MWSAFRRAVLCRRWCSRQRVTAAPSSSPATSWVHASRHYTSIPLSHSSSGTLRTTTLLTGTSGAAHSLHLRRQTEPTTAAPSASLPPVSPTLPSSTATTTASPPAQPARPTRSARGGRPGAGADALACRLSRASPLAPSPLSALATPRVVRVPRLLFFGGDIVSVTALEALYERLTAIASFALFAQTHLGGGPSESDSPHDAGEELALAKARVARFVADHLTVICPALPRGMTPEEAAAKYTRQYPVARFCAEHGLPVVPVDHPRSLVKSRLLEDILANRGGREWGTFWGSTSDGSAGAPHDPASSSSSSSSSSPVTWAARGRPLGDFDLALVVSFRYFLPKRLLRALPPVINLHPSLLPLYRGASPIFSTLLHNEPRGGVSVIQMKADQQGMDSGAILWQCPVPVELDTDIRTYFPLVTQIGAAGLCDLVFGERTVDELLRSVAEKQPQPSVLTANGNGIGGGGGDADNDDRTQRFSPPSTGPANSDVASDPHATVSDRLLEAVGNNRREGRLRVVPSSPLRPHVRSEWCTLCRAPPQITQVAVQAAAHSHKESFQQNLLLSEQQRDDKLGLKATATSSAATATSAKRKSGKKGSQRHQKQDSASVSPGCAAARNHAKTADAGASPSSGDSIYAKYALTEAVTTSMKCADVFPESVLNPTCDWPDSFTYSWKFAQEQEYDAFNHFTDDPHHAPLLGKDAAVLRFSQHTDLEVFGVWRAFVGGQYFQPAVNVVLDKWCTPVRNQLIRRGVRRQLRMKQRANRGKHTSTAASPPVMETNANDHDDCTECHPETLHTSTLAKNTFTPKSALTCDLRHAEVEADMVREAEAELRLTCTITKAIHPELISDTLREELVAVEAGKQARFYRAPPPLFASVRRRRRVANGDLADNGDTAAALTAMVTTASSDVSPEQHALVLLKCRRREAAMVRDGPRGVALAVTPTTNSTTADEDGEAADDVSAEAPEGVPPEVIYAPPPEPGNLRACLYIPPGTAYFPVSCEDIGAIKCREGWFLWKEAHLRSSAQAQPVALLRKGLAMKTGLLYPGMFSEYLR